jgi:hypothetical protein
MKLWSSELTPEREATLAASPYQILRKKGIEYEMCVFIFYTFFVWNISHSKKNLAIYCQKCDKIFK